MAIAQGIVLTNGSRAKKFGDVSGYISAVHYGDTWNDEQTHKMGRSNIVARYYPSNPNANSEETLDRD